MSAIKTFTEGKIFTPLLRFSMPILFALLLQAMYGAVDLLIIGQFCSSADVSAVATGSQIMQTITSVITGLAMGTTILLAQKIGQNRRGGSRRCDRQRDCAVCHCGRVFHRPDGAGRRSLFHADAGPTGGF